MMQELLLTERKHKAVKQMTKEALRVEWLA